jgi:hypothetical protein
MEMLINLIIQLILGVVGGNAAGAALKDYNLGNLATPSPAPSARWRRSNSASPHSDDRRRGWRRPRSRGHCGSNRRRRCASTLNVLLSFAQFERS